ncbi:Xylulose kinase [uncultured Roseburia sp.]|uniref:FGGY family carbohydrate kinase n=1 Tax=Brotonthovivens ammoniilytica TaxID=2981725 RepID=A0ABT2TKP0_9FIRM|nr:FGGY family carbohydrate kinase [Brotonthovivens ammoniilytica]MCU6762784.1 FGGY family carbohydrate kinase [Brotonthovivens ammoniilytica]SCI88769.1 Xylulose kinase [uncultured Roseburia sp.]
MEKKDKIIAYDLGTGGIKSSLFDVEGTSLVHTFQAYETRYDGSDIHEQKPEDWWNGIVETTRLLMKKTNTSPKEVKGLAISGHSLGVVPVAADGTLLRSYTPIWSDKRAGRQAAEFFKKTDYDRWYMCTGNGFPAECYSVFKIMWYRDAEPELYQKTYKILGSKDYCNFVMTGKAYTDYSYASGSGVYSLKERAYVDEYIQTAGIDKKLLPEIIPSHGVVGNLLEGPARELGLTTETKVICGGVDNSCMALGAKGTKHGRTYTSLGSSSWIAVIAKEPILDRQYLPFVFEHCVEGLYTSATSIFSAGNSFRWVRDCICPDLVEKEKTEEIDDAYDEMNKMVTESPIGANKLIFNPSFAGGAMIEESPDICGGYIGLKLGHNRNDMVRSAMEGITYNLYYAMLVLKKYQPDIHEMLLVGGGSKSRVWRQMFADVFGMRMIKTVVDQDAASLGAAALAAYGLGYWKSYDRLDEIHVVESIQEPDSEKTCEYRTYYELHRKFAHYMAIMGDCLKNTNKIAEKEQKTI